MNTKNDADRTSVNSQERPCSSTELDRLRIVGWLVLAMSVFVVTMAITFGNAPQAFVDRMNVFLAPLAVLSLLHRDLCVNAIGNVLYILVRV